MKYDYAALYSKNKQFLLSHKKTKTALLLLNDYGAWIFLLAYAFFCSHAVFQADYPPKTLVKIFCFPALALLLVAVMRLAAARHRPYEEEGAGISPLLPKKSKNNSFPSRHLTSATVIAMTILPFFPIFGCALLLLAVGLAYARFSVGWHYPSDLAVGALVGLLLGGIPLFL